MPGGVVQIWVLVLTVKGTIGCQDNYDLITQRELHNIRHIKLKNAGNGKTKQLHNENVINTSQKSDFKTPIQPNNVQAVREKK